MSPRSSYDEIYLEADEEVTTAIEKVKKSDQAAVALILPRNAVLGQSIVNLKLVYKEAAAEDKEVALVSPDPTTRNLAERVGFTAYPNLKAVSFAIPPLPKATTAPGTKPAMGRKPTSPAEQKVVPSHPQRQESDEAPALAAAGFVSQPVEADEEAIAAERGESKASAGELTTHEPASPPPSGSPEEGEIASPSPPVTASGMIPTRGNLRFFRAQKRRAAVFPMIVALILVLLGVAGIVLYWPAAHLTIQVKAQPFQETVKSTVDTEGGGGVDVEKATIPGQVLTLEQVTKSTAKTTGKKDIGNKATGAVTIQNGWDSLPHNFPAATKLRAKGGLEFVLAKEATVPGATSTIVSGKAVIVPGKVEVPVAAASPGEAYNIAPSDLKIPSLPAAQQESIYAAANAAFSGGTSNVVSVVSESDLQKLTENVKTQNREEAAAKFKEQASNQVIIDQAIQIGGQEVTAVNQVGEEAAAVEVAVNGTFRVIAFSPADQKQLLEKLLANKIPEGQILVTEGDDLTPDTSTYTLDLVSDKRLELTNNLKAFTVQKFDPQVIRRSLIGDAPDAALTIISRSLPAADVQTAITPPWWPRLPLVAKRITLDFQYRPEIKE